ncbi:MAG: COR domain-containing protein [Cyanobacteria bacterium P01_E01_bin.45]
MDRDELLSIIEQAAEEGWEELDLSWKDIAELPTDICKCQSLTKVYLNHNRLTQVPATLGNLQNLTELSLNFNQLTQVPGELGNLKNLSTLSLHDNLLSELPAKLGNLQNLVVLDLGANRLTQVPMELGNLKKLSLFYLYRNSLSELPSELGNLKKLRLLSLASNRLTEVPAELGNLQNLEELNLSLNPDLKFPPPDIVQQGRKAILVYLKQELEAGLPQWVSKLLVVGEGGTGKTSLLRALDSEDFQEQESTTHGIALGKLLLDHPSLSDVTMTLNTWDFGGQEIYHATHQFFLTNRSLFLLVWNARLGYEQGKLHYWLKTIRANAPQSPVLIVATHIDERPADLPYQRFKFEFPQIVGQISISNKTREGIFELRNAIAQAAADLPLMGESWPTAWLNVANQVRELSEKFTKPELLWQIMADCRVNPEGHKVLAQWLHELGDILFFQDNKTDDDLILTETVILDPQWVTESISKVLVDKDVIQRQGIFSRDCMNRVWCELPGGFSNVFLALMERFDLSYRTIENRDISLVVELTPHERDDWQKKWQAISERGACKEISMKFELDEIQAGIPTWFIARQHRYTLDRHWRTGVLFGDYPQDFDRLDQSINPNTRPYNHLALVTTNPEKKYLELTVRGPMPHNFFDVLREGIELTLRRYPGLQVTRLLPCPDPEKQDCKHEFNYEQLVKRLERDKPRETIECPNCLEDISVPGLLFGLHYTTRHDLIKAIASNTEKLLDNDRELMELLQRGYIRDLKRERSQLDSMCPSVFVLRPKAASFRGMEMRFSLNDVNELQFYCEAPGCWHPVGDLYPIKNPKEWLRKAAPHIQRLVKVLKFATPVIGPFLGALDADIYKNEFKADIKFMETLVGKLPNLQIHPNDFERIQADSDRGISSAYSRALYDLMVEIDPQKQWGGLNRVLTPEGEYLWLCERHTKEYNI